MIKLIRLAVRIAKHAIPLAVLVPVAFGISIGLEKMAPEKAEAASEHPAPPVRRDGRPPRVALVIGNADYPEANAPLRQPLNDTQALADALRRNGFEVDLQQNLGKDDMRRAIERFEERITPGSVALVSFGGFGIQVGRQSYMIPVDAQIWKEADVRRDGVSIDSLLSDMQSRGATVKLAILDASRRNPFERRFRAVSSGLGAIEAPQGTLLLSATAPGKAAYDGDGEHSLLIGELLKEINAAGAAAETVFNRTRIGVSRSSNGEQVPLVSSSLTESFTFTTTPGYRDEVAHQPVEEVVASPRDVQASLEQPKSDTPASPPPAVAATTGAVAPTTASVEAAPQPPVVAAKQYELASRPADKPKEAKPVKKVEAAKPRRVVDEEETVREQPRLHIRHGWRPDRPWPMTSVFPRRGFMHPFMRMRF